MAKATVQKHVHKLKRIKFKSGNASFFCVLPDCTFKVNPALALGKRSECWRCGEEFLLNEYSIRLAKPHCEKCHHPKNGKDKEESHTDNVLQAHKDSTLSGHGTVPMSESSSLADRLTSVIHDAQTGDEDI